MKSNLKKNAVESGIFRLVKGLSSSEKSYYKKLVKRHADQNEALHLRLFKILDESSFADDTDFCNLLQIENKIHYSGLKSYLIKDLLDALTFQKRNISVDTQIYFLQEQIKILHEKNLLSLAQKFCKKAIEIATRYEKYHSLVLLIHLQNRVLEFKDYKQFKNSTDEIFSALQSTIDLQKSFTDNRFLYEKVRRITYRNWLPITEDELSEISKAKDLLKIVKPSNAKHPLISLFYLNTLALCQYMLHENQFCTETCMEIFRLWKQSHHLINEYPLLFLNSANTTCYNDFLINTALIAEENLTAYESIAKAHLKIEIHQKQFEVLRFNAKLKIFLKTAQFGQVKILMQSKMPLIFSYVAEILSPVDQLSIKGSVCISYFILEQWDEAESLLSEVREKNMSIKREDILYFSLLFHLVILYEKKEWDRLDSALKAAYHLLYANKKLRPFERELMLFLGHLSVARTKRAANQLISAFLKQLDQYRNDTVRNRYFLYFNYYGWLESKVMGIRYMDYLKQRSEYAIPEKEVKTA